MNTFLNIKDMVVVIRGGGDLASGIACRLFESGFRPIMTELERPKTVRRTVSFSSAVFEKEVIIEGIKGVFEDYPFSKYSSKNYIPVVLDTKDKPFDFTGADVIVDARMLKELRNDKFPPASLKIGIGPGFEAGVDCDFVIETNRGIDLGRKIENGKPEKDTGIPGIIAGKGAERVFRSPAEGTIIHDCKIGDLLEQGDLIAHIGDLEVRAPFRGKIRGLIAEGVFVKKNEKIGDIDPRENVNCFLVSDKARAIGGGVLEAILSHFCFYFKKD